MSMTPEVHEAWLRLKEYKAFREAEADRLLNVEWQLRKELQDICPHKEAQSQYFYHPHNGDEWATHTCKLCQYRWDT